MRRLLAAILLVLAAVVLVFSAPGGLLAGGGTSSVPKILVGLFTATSFTISVPEDTCLITSQGETKIVGHGRQVTFSLSGGEVLWHVQTKDAVIDRGASTGPVFLGGWHKEGSFLGVESQVGGSPNLSGLRFAGDFIILPASGGVFLVNAVEVEDYVASVVSSEMPDDWPLEALKAQAIASRSYALYRCGMAREEAGTENGFEDIFQSLTPDSISLSCSDQVYRGADAVDTNAKVATSSTRGMLMVYDGKPVAAYFHSDAAGMTEDARYVWGGTAPYLAPVQEVSHESPYSSWSASLNLDLLASQLGTGGSELLAVTGQQAGPSGRWSKVMVRTGAGEFVLKANEFRLRTGLRSLLFSSYRIGGGSPTVGNLNPQIEVYATNGRETLEVRPGGAVIQGASSTVICSGASTALSPAEEGPVRFVFCGKGWGHGVGLSQWGAKAMAEQDASSEAILSHYYPGMTVEKWY